jgi:hypothetical protein
VKIINHQEVKMDGQDPAQKIPEDQQEFQTPKTGYSETIESPSPAVPELFTNLNLNTSHLIGDYSIIPTGDKYKDAFRLLTRIANNLNGDRLPEGLSPEQKRRISAEAAMVLLYFRGEIEDLTKGDPEYQVSGDENYRRVLNEANNDWDGEYGVGKMTYNSVWVPEFRKEYNRQDSPAVEGKNFEKEPSFEDKIDMIEHWAQAILSAEQSAMVIMRELANRLRASAGEDAAKRVELGTKMLEHSTSEQQVNAFLAGLAQTRSELSEAKYDESKQPLVAGVLRKYYSILNKGYGLIKIADGIYTGIGYSESQEERVLLQEGFDKLNIILAGLGANVISAQPGQKIDFITVVPTDIEENSDPQKSETIKEVVSVGYAIDTKAGISLAQANVIRPAQVIAYK